MTGPQDPAAASGDRFGAAHADREQVIEALKDAFVQGRLTRDELDVRAGRALAARTSAELAVLTADIPVVARAVRPQAPAYRWPLTRAVAGSGGCLFIGFAALWIGGHFDNPLGPSPYKHWIPLCVLVAFIAVGAAPLILGHGVGASVKQRRSRRQAAAVACHPLPPGGLPTTTSM
jgi:hypothetical protein